MPAPIPTSRSASQTADPATAHTVTYPATMTVGEKVVCAFTSQGGGAQVVTFPAGWTTRGEGGLGGAGGIYHEVAERTIDGTEGATFQITTSISVEATHRCWSGPFDTITAQAAPTTGNSATASYPAVNVSLGDYLILALCGLTNDMAISTPTNYGDAFNQNTGGGESVSQGTFERSLTGITTETPGNSTFPAAERWATFTAAIAAAAAAGQIIPVGQVTESSLAQAMGRSKLAGVGMLAEGDTALVVQPSKTGGVELVAEISQAQPFGHAKARALGMLAELDAALAVGARKSRTAGTVIELDLSQALQGVIGLTISQATEADFAHAIATATGMVVGQALESDEARTLGRAKERQTGLVTESDSVFPVSVERVFSLLQAAESDAAFSVAIAKLQALGLITETDVAFAMSIIGGNAIGPIDNPGIQSASQSLGIRSASVARGLTSRSVYRGITRH